MTFLPDPCPLPEGIKKRTLVEKDKTIYAPMSGVGGIVYDKDAVYIDLGGSHAHEKENNDSDIIQNIINNIHYFLNKSFSNFRDFTSSSSS